MTLLMLRMTIWDLLGRMAVRLEFTAYAWNHRLRWFE